MSEPFVQLRGASAAPGARRQTPAGPPPPPPAPGQQGGGGMPQGQPQPMGSTIPPPPFNAIPIDLRGKNVQISDIRPERMTDGDARERLTSILVYHFRKRSTSNEVDLQGRPVKPTWLNCEIWRDEVDQLEAKRSILRLDRADRDEKTSTENKKGKLGDTMKEQLARQLLSLQEYDADKRYIYSLAQLDLKYKYLPEQKIEITGKKKSGTKYESDRKKSKSRTKVHQSMTAFFKRAPRSEENCLQLWHMQQHHIRQHHQLQQQAAVMMMAQQQQQHSAQWQQQQQQQQPQMPPPQQQPPQQHGDPRNSNPNIKVMQAPRKNDKRGARSVHSSSDSGDSDWSASDGEYETPLSSVGSRISSKGKGRRGRRMHHKDNPEYFGMEQVPRRLSVPAPFYVIAGSPPAGPVPLAPQPRLPPVDTERLQNMRYLDQIQREDEQRRFEARSRRPIEAPPPRPVSRQRSYDRMSPIQTRVDSYFDDYDGPRGRYREYEVPIQRFERMTMDEDVGRFERHRADGPVYTWQGSPPRRAASRGREVYVDRDEFYMPRPFDGETYAERAAQDYMDGRPTFVETRPYNSRASESRPTRIIYKKVYR